MCRLVNCYCLEVTRGTHGDEMPVSSVSLLVKGGINGRQENLRVLHVARDIRVWRKLSVECVLCVLCVVEADDIWIVRKCNFQVIASLVNSAVKTRDC